MKTYRVLPIPLTGDSPRYVTADCFRVREGALWLMKEGLTTIDPYPPVVVVFAAGFWAGIEEA